MGQVRSIPVPTSAVADFINLPKEAIMSIWLAYNLYGEGWGLTYDQFECIFKEASYLKQNYSFSDTQLRLLFNTFDTDKNGLVDALEVLVAVGLLSGMDTIEKIFFTFGAFDFDSRGSLSVDEANLLFLSATKGLMKASPTTTAFTSVSREDAQKFAALVFMAMEKDPFTARVSVEDFKNYCVAHPIISNWVKAVSSLSTGEDNLKIVVPEDRARDEWVTSVNSPYRPNAARNKAKQNIVDTNDIIVEVDDNSSQSASATQDDQQSLAGSVLGAPWMNKVYKLRPEELPPKRVDIPEDVIEPFWIGGMNTRRRKKGSSESQTFVSSQIPRNVRYRSLANDQILFASGTHLVNMKRQEETNNWIQEFYNEHNHPISCLDVHYGKNLLITASCPIESNVEEITTRVILWDLSNFSVKKRFEVPYGIKFVDINAAGTLFLTVADNVGNTLTVYDLLTDAVIFSKKALWTALDDTIYDVRFLGTSAMIALACAKQGLVFYVNEESGMMGKNNMQLYEERTALYGTLGKTLKGVGISCIARLEGGDEFATGAENGQIIIWHGRTIAQVIQGHQGRVTALDYNATTRTLISGGDDGTVRLYEITDSSSKASSNKGPKLPSTRVLQTTASFDILGHPLNGFTIAAITLSEQTDKALISTATNELIEVKCKIVAPTPEELQEAEAAGGEEGAVPSSGVKLGDDVNNGPIVSSHFLPDTADENGSIVTHMTKLGSNGFATIGSDQTIRFWQPIAEGEGNTGFKSVKTIKMDSQCTHIASSSANIAVALSNTENPTRHGAVHLFSVPDGTYITELTDNKVLVCDLKLSAEGNLVAIASSDGSVYIHGQVEGAWTLKGKLVTNDACDANCVEAMDLSSDGQFIRCYYGGTKDLRVFDLVTSFGSEMFQVADANAKAAEAASTEDSGTNPGAAAYDQLRGISWLTQSCPFNWDTLGVPLFQKDAVVSMSTTIGNPTTSSSNIFDRSNHLFLSAAQTGLVEVHRVPMYVAFNPAYTRRISAHTGPISGLCFFEEGGVKLITTGAFDGLIKVWKITYDTDEIEPDLPEASASEEEEKPAEEEEEEEGEGNPKKLPVIYDSGDEEDLVDGNALKKHLIKATSRNNKQHNGGKDDESSKKLTEGNEELESIKEDEESKPKLESFDEKSVFEKYCDFLGNESPEELAKFAEKAFNSPTCLVPNDELQVDWIYGSTIRRTRNAVMYTPEGQIVYPAGSVAIIYDKLAGKQTYLSLPHRDEITALDISAAKSLGATGHKGSGSIAIHVWKTTSGEIVHVLECGNVNGISAVKFSPDGKLLFAACQDAVHTVMVFSVQDGILLASVPTGSQKILAAAVSDALSPVVGGNPAVPLVWRVVLGGVKHYKLLTYNIATRVVSLKVGQYGADVKKSHVNCVSALPMGAGDDGAPTGNEFIVGLSDGSVGYIARGENKVGGFTPDILKGPITAMTVARIKPPTADEPSPTYKILVGGVNGLIKILDNELQPLSEFNLYLKDYGLYALGRVRGFKSLQIDKLNRKVLYGTAGNEIGEIDFVTGENINSTTIVETAQGTELTPQAVNIPLITAHFREKLIALDAHPLRQECLTGGDDKTLRIWDLSSHSLITLLELPSTVTCGRFAPNGHLVVVGLHRRKDESVGRMAVISYLQRVTRIVHLTQDAADEIKSIVFSPDGTRVYAASLDHVIYVYDSLNNFQLLYTLKGHREGIRSLDISANGRYLVSEGVHDELLLWDITGRSEISRTGQRNEILGDIGLHWYVRQNRFGLHSVGIFPSPQEQGQAAAWGEIVAVTQSSNKALVFVGYEYGALRMYSNPCIPLASPYKAYQYHTPGGIEKITCSVDDQYILTAGTHDKLLIQWRLESPNTSPDAPPSDEATAWRTLTRQKTKISEDIFDHSFIVKGVDFRPHQIKSSSVPHSGQLHFPGSTMVQLTNIYGHQNAYNNRIGSYFCGHGEIITTFGKAVTILESNATQLRLWNAPAIFNALYTNPLSKYDIGSLAVSACGRYVSVGYLPITFPVTSIADKAPIAVAPWHIYQAPTGDLITEISGNVLSGVENSQFSESGHYLAALGRDKQHTLYVYTSISGRWDDAMALYASNLSILPVTLLTFLNHGVSRTSAGCAGVATGNGDYYDLVTAGEGHIKFWKIMGKNVVSAVGVYGKEIDLLSVSGDDQPPKGPITAVAAGFDSGLHKLFSGDVDGQVFAWEGTVRTRLLERHETAITSMCSFGGSSTTNKAGLVVISSSTLTIWYTSTGSTQLIQRWQVSDMLARLSWSKELYLFEGLLSQTKALHVTCDSECRQLLVTLNNGHLLSVSTDSGNVKSVLEGHPATHSVRQMVVYPYSNPVAANSPPLVLTLGTDQTVRVWKFNSVEQVKGGFSLPIPPPRNPAAEAASDLVKLSGYLLLTHQPTAGMFWNGHILVLGIHNPNPPDGEGPSSADKAGLLFLDFHPTKQSEDNNNNNNNNNLGEYELTVFHRLNHIGTGPINAIQATEDRAHLAVASSDGNVYLYQITSQKSDDAGSDKSYVAGIGQFQPMGYLLVHPSGAPVCGLDFAAPNNKSATRFLRTFGENHAKFNGKVEVGYFDLALIVSGGGLTGPGNEQWTKQAGGKIQDVGVLESVIKNLEWESVSSPVAPEARGLSMAKTNKTINNKECWRHVESLAISSDNQLLCAGYHDGTIRIARYPMYSRSEYNTANNPVEIKLNYHAFGPVQVAFTSTVILSEHRKLYRFVSYGVQDGTFMYWAIEVDQMLNKMASRSHLLPLA